MVKNSTYKNGSVIAVWINADNRQDALENYWSFWNHGATSAEDLHWISETEGYFWTSRKNLKRYFKNSTRAIMLNDLGEDYQFDRHSGRATIQLIAEKASKRYKALMDEQGPNPLAKTQVPVHMMGTIDAESSSGNFDDYLTQIIQKA